MIDQYQNLIYSICYRLTGDYFEAEDLAQDTFLSAYKNLSSFDGKNERAWLCRIATNKCIDYLKQHCEGKSVLVVAHGQINRNIIAQARGIPLGRLKEIPLMKNGTIIQLTINN